MNQKQQETDIRFMRRAIDLARLGLSNVSPNPHVGAVVVYGDRIIGEGYHRRCGSGHAEVNAIASVKPEDRPLLSEATIYVTLEPCSHYGKTPPCSKLIIDTGIRRVVAGTADPNPKVNGRGFAMLREAGVEVTVLDGEIGDECRRLDQKFMSRLVNGRPYITLKWAQSHDGFMSKSDGSPFRFSTPLTSTLVHKLRSEHDAILTTSSTVMADNPRLDCRLWSAGRSPVKIIVDRNRRVKPDALVFNGAETVVTQDDLHEIIESACRRGLNSILVEAGPTFLKAMIKAGLWDSIRVEISPVTLGKSGGNRAPELPCLPQLTEIIDGNTIAYFNKNN